MKKRVEDFEKMKNLKVPEEGSKDNIARVTRSAVRKRTSTDHKVSTPKLFFFTNS